MKADKREIVTFVIAALATQEIFTPRFETTFFAFGLAGDTSVTSVQDQPVVGDRDLFLRDMLHQLLFRFQRGFAVILSAQCTDKRVNMITPALFRDFPTPEVMAASTSEVIFEYIRSVSYPNNKSKHLVGMAKMLMSDFDGVVPSDIDELQKLPGVGRKTANVIASVVYNKPAMAVDTHVFRVANRIGLTNNSKTPLER